MEQLVHCVMREDSRKRFGALSLYSMLIRVKVIQGVYNNMSIMGSIIH